MRTLVAKEAVSSPFKNTFVVSVETYKGNAYEYKTFEVPVHPADAPALEHVLAKIRRMTNNRYNLVVDADKFFGRDDFVIKDGKVLSFELEHWPQDYELDRYYSYNSHRYYYYNRTGKKFHAQIENV